MFKALFITTAAAAGLLAAAPGTATHAQPTAGAAASMPIDRQALPRAIRAAEAYGGGRVLEIRFRVRQGGVAGFDAVLAKGTEFSRLRVDLPSYAVAVIQETDIPAWMANWVLKADAASLAKAKLPLVDAVAKAEAVAGAPAGAAGVAKPLTGGNAVLAYNVAVLTGGRPQRVVIDAVTGEQIADPDPLVEGWSPEQAMSESLKK